MGNWAYGAGAQGKVHAVGTNVGVLCSVASCLAAFGQMRLEGQLWSGARVGVRVILPPGREGARENGELATAAWLGHQQSVVRLGEMAPRGAG